MGTTRKPYGKGEIYHGTSIPAEYSEATKKKAFKNHASTHDGYELNLLWQSFHSMYVYQVLMLCTLNVYRVLCQ